MKATKMGKIPRIEAVDALRGFAVIAILLVHSVEHFIFPVYPDPESLPNWLNILDRGVFSIVFSLFAGKSYSIFALLFGLTFYIQYTNQQYKGKDFGYRFLWRLLLLAGFATLNAAFFPAGDVLLLFVFVGILFFVVRKCSDKVVLALSILFLLQPVEWYHCIASSLTSGYRLPDLGVGSMYEEMAENTLNGSYVDFFKKNITLGQKASLFWAIEAGRYSQTAGLFLLGLIMGRKQFFISSKENIQRWIKVLIAGAILFGILYPLKVELVDTMQQSVVKQTAGVVFDMWQKFAFTMVLVSSFLLLYQQSFFRKLTFNLKFYGKMSLTNYVSQSLLGALIFFPIGLYLAPYCGYTMSLLIGIGLVIIQIAFCRWWLNNHKYGPLEYIWHKLTWIRFK